MEKEINPKHLEEKLQVDMSWSVRKYPITQSTFFVVFGTESHYVHQASLAVTKICLPLPASAFQCWDERHAQCTIPAKEPLSNADVWNMYLE